MKYVVVISALLTVASGAIAQDTPPVAPPGGGMPSPEQIVAMMDANKDGLIGKAEAQGPLAQHFDFVDADKDGTISLAELKVAMTAMRPPEPAQGEAVQ
jgi:hypothetical protein